MAHQSVLSHTSRALARNESFTHRSLASGIRHLASSAVDLRFFFAYDESGGTGWN